MGVLGGHTRLPQTVRQRTALIIGTNGELEVTDNIIPTVLPALTQFYKIRLNPMIDDIDLTHWIPTGLLPGAEVTFVKESGKGVIKWTENDVSYDYLSRVGELMTLKWTGLKFIIV